MHSRRTALLSSTSQDDAEPKVTPALYSIPNACQRAGGIGVTKIYEFIAKKDLTAVKMGGRTFITADSLEAFIAGLQRADIRTGLEPSKIRLADAQIPRELVQQIHGHAADATALLAEYVDAAAHRGTGARRDPNGVLRDLRETLHDLQGAADKLRESAGGSSRP
jgi:hypothetical protein